MKKFQSFIALLLIICTLSSCATVFGGHVNAYQRTKPVAGQQTRPLRVGAFIADIVLFWPGLVIDFATCAIYRPHDPDQSSPAPTTVAPTSGTNN
jgi:hypothetical protein